MTQGAKVILMKYTATIHWRVKKKKKASCERVGVDRKISWENCVKSITYLSPLVYMVNGYRRGTYWLIEWFSSSSSSFSSTLLSFTGRLVSTHSLFLLYSFIFNSFMLFHSSLLTYTKLNSFTPIYCWVFSDTPNYFSIALTLQNQPRDVYSFK